MTEFFKPYEGKKPYLFISYSHRNSAEVIDVIRILHDRRYRLWYDEGIPAGSDWPRNIADHMRDCRMVLFFLSRTALASPNCLSEITTAKKQGKTILLMKLEEIGIQEMDEKWQVCLKGAAEIGAEGSARERAERILACPQMTAEFLGTEEDFREDGVGRKSGSAVLKAAIILASVVLVLAIGSVAGILTGVIDVTTPTPLPSPTPTAPPSPTPTPDPTPTPTPKPTPTPSPTPTPAPEQTANIPEEAKGLLTQGIDFPDETQEKAIRKALDAQEGDLSLDRLLEITELNIVGVNSYKSLKGLEVAEDGTVLMNSIPMKEGNVRDLRLMPYMAYLKTLSLVGQPLENVSGLSGLTLLQELTLTGSKVNTVEGLQNLPSLQTLNLAHTQVKDLRPLKSLPILNRVTVSVDMLPLELDPEAHYDVIVTK